MYGIIDSNKTIFVWRNEILFSVPGTHTIQRNRAHIYHTFIPKSLSDGVNIKTDEELTMLLSKAHRLLGLLEGMSRFIENIDVIELILMKKEALLSCQIDGSTATFGDILYPFKKKNKHVKETLNCVDAIENGKKKIKNDGYSNRLLCDLYKILMADENKETGECYRKIQLFDIPGVFVADIETYNPTAPEDIQNTMDDLEKYIKTKQDIDVLIKIALTIYQFVTISPFEIGNKKMGSLLIGQLLQDSKILSRQLLCYSDFIILDKIGFYDRLSAVRFSGNYIQWVKHFLKGIIFSSEKAIDTVNKLVTLKEQNRKKILASGKADIIYIKLLDCLEQNPMINIKNTAACIGFSYNTVAKAVYNMEALRIIKQSNNLSRNRCYAYQQYLDILFGCRMNDLE